RASPGAVERAHPRVERGVPGAVSEVARLERQGRRKLFPRPGLGAPVPGELIHPSPEARPELLVAQALPPEADEGEALGKPVIEIEVIEGRHQFAPGQIAPAPEDRQNRPFGTALSHHGPTAPPPLPAPAPAPP